MRSNWTFATSAICALLTIPATAGQQGQGFRSTAEVVPVFATVRDQAGRLVPNLTREDFEILDNGKPQPVTLFDNSPQPVRLITLLDFSGSMSNNLPILRTATLELLKQLGPDDLIRVGTFGKDIKLTPSFSKDAEEVEKLFPAFIPGDAPTPLWLSVEQAMGEFAAGPSGRRVILVLSDGKDSGFIPGKRLVLAPQIEERATKDDVMIYGIGMRSSGAPVSQGGIQSLADRLVASLPDPALSIVATNTGGGYVELHGRDNLSTAFARVVDELKRQYLLGFAPPARDGKTHKIEVRVKDRTMTVQARKAYVATNK